MHPHARGRGNTPSQHTRAERMGTRMATGRATLNEGTASTRARHVVRNSDAHNQESQIAVLVSLCAAPHRNLT
eukprot:6183545-Pleurochrysis_carterae.AAC.1